jgi:hypothetical protein
VRTPALVAGCGQFVLVRREAYLAAGGHGAVRATLHDGLVLARRMKATGHAVEVFDGSDLAACRMYAGLGATWRGFRRNAYEALGSPAALAAITVLNALAFVVPFGGLAWAVAAGRPMEAALLGAAVALVAGLRLALARRFGAPAWTAAATPVAVLLMIGIQLHAFVNHCTGRRVVWRARAYAPGGGAAD